MLVGFWFDICHRFLFKPFLEWKIQPRRENGKNINKENMPSILLLHIKLTTMPRLSALTRGHNSTLLMVRSHWNVVIHRKVTVKTQNHKNVHTTFTRLLLELNLKAIFSKNYFQLSHPTIFVSQVLTLKPMLHYTHLLLSSQNYKIRVTSLLLRFYQTFLS